MPPRRDDRLLDRGLKALADGTRRRILQIVAEQPGIRVQDLVTHFPISRFAVMKHVNVLEAAWLVRRVRDGVSKRLYLDTEPLEEIPAWIEELKARAITAAGPDDE